MASSTVRHRVKFAERPPQVVRYSYHAGDLDASTSLFFAKLQQVMEMEPLKGSDPLGNLENLRTSVDLGNSRNTDLQGLWSSDSLRNSENSRNFSFLRSSRASDPLGNSRNTNSLESSRASNSLANSISSRSSNSLGNSRVPDSSGYTVTLRNSNPSRDQRNPRLNPNRHSSYEPTYANVNINVKPSEPLDHHYDNIPVKSFDSVKKHHKWSENNGVETADVVQKPCGITRVMIGDNDEDTEGLEDGFNYFI